MAGIRWPSCHRLGSTDVQRPCQEVNGPAVQRGHDPGTIAAVDAERRVLGQGREHRGGGLSVQPKDREPWRERGRQACGDCSTAWGPP